MSKPKSLPRTLLDPENVYQLSWEGLTAYRIGKILGINDKAVAKVAKHNRIVLRKGNQSRTSTLWVQKTDALIEKFEAGDSSIAAIARDLGVTKNQAIGRLQTLDRIGERRLQTRAKPSRPYLEFPPPGLCLYPNGGERERPTAFCYEQTRPGSPYCHYHHNRCYNKPPKASDPQPA